MVDGLDHFVTHFAGFESHFILIGGTACDLWMGDFGLEFRATKDLDIVLLADSLPAAVSSSGSGHSFAKDSMRVLSRAKRDHRSIASRIPRTRGTR